MPPRTVSGVNAKASCSGKAGTCQKKTNSRLVSLKRMAEVGRMLMSVEVVFQVLDGELNEAERNRANKDVSNMMKHLAHGIVLLQAMGIVQGHALDKVRSWKYDKDEDYEEIIKNLQNGQREVEKTMRKVTADMIKYRMGQQKGRSKAPPAMFT